MVVVVFVVSEAGRKGKLTDRFGLADGIQEARVCGGGKRSSFLRGRNRLVKSKNSPGYGIASTTVIRPHSLSDFTYCLRNPA